MVVFAGLRRTKNSG